MPKYTVEFTIDAESLGHATNRALVALYKGDLDAEDVKVSEKGKPSGNINIHVDDAAVTKAARGGYVRGGYTGRTGVDVAPGSADYLINVEELKEHINKVRGNIRKEPHKDDVN